ncbi:MAG: hypothetical protein NXI24_20170 [bacterium]|nr:hypothetical protein [bacterium]
MKSIAGKETGALLFRALSLAVVVGLSFVIPGTGPAAEMRPHIPSPHAAQDARGEQSGKDSKIPESKSQPQPKQTRRVVRAFPATNFLAFLTYTDEQLEILSRSEEPAFDGVVLGRLRARMARVVSPGFYRFDRECPLVFDPKYQEPEAAFVVLQIRCLPAHHRRAYAVRLYPGNALSGVRFSSYELLRKLKTRREFIGEARLAAADLLEGFAPLWRWQGDAALPYANAMLDTLRARYAMDTEERLLAPETLRANTKTLLRRFAGLTEDAGYSSQRDLAEDFRAVYPNGVWIYFGRSCPLVVEEALRREPGTELLRLHLRISCLEGFDRLRPVRLLLPEKALKELRSEAGGAALPLAPGERIHAGLKFRRISSENTPAGLQFLPVWDTIKEIRPDLPLVRPNP